MGQKRKVVVAESPPLPLEPPRKRSLLKLLSSGAESAAHQNGDSKKNSEAEDAKAPRFRNKEKTLILCSRRITFR